MRGEQACLQ